MDVKSIVLEDKKLGNNHGVLEKKSDFFFFLQICLILVLASFALQLFVFWFGFCFSLRTKGSFKKAAYLLESCWDKEDIT